MAQIEQEMTMEELSKVLYQTAVAKCILANQSALAHNEVLAQTPGYKFKIKQLGKPFIAELIKHEKSEFELMEKAEKELEQFKGKHPIDVAFERSEKIISLVARMAFVDYDDIEETLYALAADRSSVIGVVKKVNRKRKESK